MLQSLGAELPFLVGSILHFMALYKTLRSCEFVLDLGTVKRPVLAYVWVSEETPGGMSSGVCMGV